MEYFQLILIVKPLFRDNDNTNIIDYRLLVRLPHINNIFENIIYYRLSNFIIKLKDRDR